MAEPVHADRARWEFRQCRLAYRLLCAEARTQTICRFTSLSAPRLAKWRKRWGFDEAERGRGPAPNSFTPFFRVPALRAEAAYLGVLCEAFGLLQHDDQGRTFYSFTTGERLCDLFEFHRTSCPTASVNFDQLLLLARGLQIGKSIVLGRCTSCGAALVQDPLGLTRSTCDTCRHPRPSNGGAQPADQKRSTDCSNRRTAVS